MGNVSDGVIEVRGVHVYTYTAIERPFTQNNKLNKAHKNNKNMSHHKPS